MYGWTKKTDRPLYVFLRGGGGGSGDSTCITKEPLSPLSVYDSAVH